MKKIIALSLLALTLGANVPSTVQADGIMYKAGNIVAYPLQKTWEATKHAAKATKEVALVGVDLVKGTLPIAAIVVTGVAIVCGFDVALKWANQIGLPATFFNHYTFGTFYNAVYTWVAPIVVTAPEFFKSLPATIKSFPELTKSIPQTAIDMFNTSKFGQAAQASWICRKVV